ncbi:MAG: 4-(cytidine 5'-diphospho)-2-C-methyl-D-erythritol kinase [Gemmatimonadota bacterium]
MSVSVAAPAKVNLSLRVLGKRDDGFHEIRTVFQAVDLADEVRIEWSARDVSLRVEGADVGPEAENLAYRAAMAFLDASGEARGVRIHLVKHIPAGAGLGGGSSDAAAVLRCLAAMSPSPPPKEELHRIGAALGSDVPFFLGSSPLAMAEGRGERLTALPPLPEAHVVLVMPPVHVSTAEAYRALGRERVTAEDSRPRAVAPQDDAPRSWHDISFALHNDFEAPVASRHTEVARSLSALRGAGASGALLSGSGAAAFGIFGGAEEAARVASILERDLGWRCTSVRTLTSMPELVAS